MALASNELYSTGMTTEKLRFYPRRTEVKTFAAGSGTIAKLTPVTFNETTGFWQVWSGKHNEINTITPTGTVSGGNFTITVDGEVTAAIAHDANAAAIQTALEKLGVVDVGDVTVTGGPLSATGPVVPVVITWGGKFLHKTVAVSVQDSVTGGGSIAMAETQAGVNTTGIKGFTFESHTLAAGGESTAIVITAGDLHYDDLVLPAGESAAVFKDALRVDTRPLDLIIDGLTKVR